MFVRSITAPINDNTMISLNDINLENKNNYFEIVDGNKTMRPYIDIDGEMININNSDFYNLDNQIIERLRTIKDCSILSSSKYKSLNKSSNKNQPFKVINKLSYRLTFYNEECNNYIECKELVRNHKYPMLKNLLGEIIDVNDSKNMNSLNVDLSVYRTRGKMRCVNAYKDDVDKERINKLIMGTIDQTLISLHNNMEIENIEIENNLETKLQPLKIKNDFENIVVVSSKEETKTDEKIKMLKEQLKKEQEKLKRERKREKEKTIEDFQSHIIYTIVDKYILNYYLDCIKIEKLEHNDWCKIVMAYKKCGGDFEKLVEWNKKSSNFNFDGLTKLWDNYDEDDIDLTFGTIKYYANKSNLNEYNNVIKIIDYTIELIKSSTEKSMCMLYISLNKNNLYVYKDVFYIFRNGKWCCSKPKDIEFLRYDCNVILNDFLTKIWKDLKNIVDESDKDDENYENNRKTYNKLTEIKTLVNKTQWLNNIVREIKCYLLNNQEKTDIFDKQYHLFTFQNVIFDLNTKQQIEFHKDLYITMDCGNKYIEPTKQELNTIHKIFTSIFPNREILKCYLSILRTGLSGYRLERLVVANGSGRNGKGVVNELFQYLLGNYFIKLPIDLLTKNINLMGANPQIANLHKKRLALASEPADGVSLRMNTIKELTGCNSISARGLYQEETNTEMLLTLILEANMKPMLDGNMDDAILERILDIPFPNSFTNDIEKIDNIKYFKANPLYKEENFKKQHYSALFKYILDNTDNELYVPEEIKERSKSYVMDNDDFLGWITDNYILTDDDNDVIKIKDIFNCYKNGDYYNNMTKKQKRQNNYKNFNEKIKHHLVLRKKYREKTEKMNGKLVGCKRLHGIKEKFECDLSDIDSD
jgi:phage/plasmid-associated DNA primase